MVIVIIPKGALYWWHGYDVHEGRCSDTMTHERRQRVEYTPASHGRTVHWLDGSGFCTAECFMYVKNLIRMPQIQFNNKERP